MRNDPDHEDTKVTNTHEEELRVFAVRARYV
jgi:hypothetical protein